MGGVVLQNTEPATAAQDVINAAIVH